MSDFQYQLEQFADLRILRYNIPGFTELPLKQKLYIYYLSEAGLCGRDIIWDQNNEHNLWLRRCFETMMEFVVEERDSFLTFFKRILFANGLHHHYSTDKLKPDFSKEQLTKWIELLPLSKLETLAVSSHKELSDKLNNILFNDAYLSKRVCQDSDKDLVESSANNFYKNVTQKEAEAFYQLAIDQDDKTPISYGLNSQLVKVDGVVKERVWKVDGAYSKAIKRIVYWLKKAADVAENLQQKVLIKKLCEFYTSGDLTMFDEYSIEWLKEQEGDVDFINGFIEVYGDPLGYKGTWESLVNIIDKEESKKAAVISEYAQWFEDHSPVNVEHRKKEVKGVSMKVINAIMLGGDCYPASPLGINLPNAEWIREMHGSKSVSLQNISYAYERASLSSGVIEEFAFSMDEVMLHKKYGAIADNLHTHLHECVGHGSGRLEDGVRTDALKAYGSVIEEARADLFGLYFMADNKMLELNLVPHMDVAKAQYNSYIRNGLLVQLARISKDSNIEQTHMRNRQLIASWVRDNGNGVVEKVVKDGKTYCVINDYRALHQLFGELLTEVQRIKSQGDYEAAQKLVETYGVKVDKEIHNEVLERYQGLGVAPYSGFVNPKLEPIINGRGDIEDVKISYDEGFLEQMLRYNQQYGYLG